MHILKHPLHIMLVHFPVALLPMDLIFNFLAVWYVRSDFLLVAFCALAGGVSIGWLAVASGAADLITWKSDNEKDEKQVLVKGVIHGTLQITVIMVFSGFALLQWRNYPDLEFNSTGILIAKTALVLAMFTGNYFGGELVLKYLNKRSSS